MNPNPVDIAPENYQRGELLERLSKKLVNVTGNDLINKRLSGRGAARTFNICDELSEVVFGALFSGRKLYINGLRENDEEYFEDEETPRFKHELEIELKKQSLFEEHQDSGKIRRIKDEVRSRLGMAKIKDLIPDRDVDLEYGDVSRDKNIVKGKREIQTDIVHEHTVKLLQKIERERIHIFRERGQDSLYIVFGFLEWKKEDVLKNKYKTFNSAICYFRIRFEIEGKKRFKLVAEGELQENQELIEALENENGIKPPKISDYLIKDKKFKFSLKEYHDAFRHYIRKYTGWRVRNRIAVGIFKSRGISPNELYSEGYSEISVDRVEAIIAGSGFTAEPNAEKDVDSEANRKKVPAFALPVDSSQHSAILEVAEGRDIVIEGPPGTGKSHTIVNIIADAIRRGKRVLFLAQKVVALDVVYSRIKELGFDNKCLKLFSSTATAKDLYGDGGQINQKLTSVRTSMYKYNELSRVCEERDHCLTELNDYNQLLNKEIYGKSYQEIITYSKLLEKDINGLETPDFKIPDNYDLASDDKGGFKIREIEQIFAELDSDSKSLLKQIRCEYADPFDLGRFVQEAENLSSEIKHFVSDYGEYTPADCDDILNLLSVALPSRTEAESSFTELCSIRDLMREQDPLNNLCSDLEFKQYVDLDGYLKISTKTRVKRIFKILQDVRVRHEEITSQYSDLLENLSKANDLVPSFEFQYNQSNKYSSKSFCSDSYPDEYQFFDVEFIKLDISRLSSISDLIKIIKDQEQSILETICSVVEYSEINYHYRILKSINFNTFKSSIPFTKYSKSKKYIQNLFNGKISVSQSGDELLELLKLTKDYESNKAKLSEYGECLYTSYNRKNFTSACSYLEAVICNINAINNIGAELNRLAYLNVSYEQINVHFNLLERSTEFESKINSYFKKYKDSTVYNMDAENINWNIKIFSDLNSLFERYFDVQRILQISSEKVTVNIVHSLLLKVTKCSSHLSKVFSINTSLVEVNRKLGISDWLKSVLFLGIPVYQTYIAHLYRYVTKKIAKKDPELFQYKQQYINNLKIKFKHLEKKARGELIDKIRSYMPRESDVPTTHSHKVSQKRGLSLLNHVRSTNARVTVRELCHRSSNALSHYVQCYFMTPSSVSYFLPKDLEFDMVIIDEASQMLPEEAVGSLLRSKQAVIVGDPQQMPPYRGMVSTLFDEEADEDDDDGIDKQTSILDLAARNFSDYRRLRYHYRSEDENLIKFSNKEFYNNDLITVPNQGTLGCMGVHHFDAGGVYKVASRNPNPVEAEKLVDLILNESRSRPNWSLGVAVMNKQQALRVEELLRIKTENDNKFEAFEKNWRESSEHFFIKNLENVQGDERDTIIISTVYGRDSDGKAHNRFGPINFSKGQNRINVLVTRAKKRLLVCSSIFPNDITANSKGAQVLRRYLQYSITGEIDGVRSSSVSEEDHYYDAPWEKWFHDRLEEDGFIVDPQVGVSSWRIDLGVKHKDYPAGYICGIELDGPDHLSLSARDRDLERQSTLERKGWTIFRVWSMDFFNDMEGEYQIIKNAVQSALDEKIQKLDNLEEDAVSLKAKPGTSELDSESLNENSPDKPTLISDILGYDIF